MNLFRRLSFKISTFLIQLIIEKKLSSYSIHWMTFSELLPNITALIVHSFLLQLIYKLKISSAYLQIYIDWHINKETIFNIHTVNDDILRESENYKIIIVILRTRTI